METERFIEVWNNSGSVHEVHAQFPELNRGACAAKAHRLRKKGHTIKMMPKFSPFTIRRGIEARFWEKVHVAKDNDCWEWQAGMNRSGYGTIFIKGFCTLAHRLSYEIEFGKFDKNLCVLHRCDSPHCVNLRHLFLGTLADNVADRVAKGRSKGPEKTTSKQIITIIEMRNSGKLIREISIAVKLSESYVSTLLSGKIKSWRNLLSTLLPIGSVL